MLTSGIAATVAGAETIIWRHQVGKKTKRRPRNPTSRSAQSTKRSKRQKNDRRWLSMLLGALTLLALFVGIPALMDYYFPKEKPTTTRHAARHSATKEPKRPTPRPRPTEGFLAHVPRAPADTLFRDAGLAKAYEQAIADLEAGKPPMPIRRRLEKLLPDSNGDPGRPHLLVAAAYTALKTRDGRKASQYLSTLEKEFPDNSYGTFANVMALDAQIIQEAKKPDGATDGGQTARDVLAKAQEIADSGVEDDTRAYALFVAAKAYGVLGQKSNEAETYLEVAETYPRASQAPTALLRAANSFHRQQKVDRAIDTLERLIQQYPKAKATKQARKTIRELRLIGKPAPELVVEDWVNGAPSPISSLKGKVVLLAFWQTWCPHCREELPKLSILYDEYRDKGLVVIGATKNDHRQDEATLKTFLEEHPVSFPVARVNPVSSSDYVVSGIPAGVLIDKKGVIRDRAHPMYLTRDLIDALLAED